MNILITTFTFSGDEDLTELGIENINILRTRYPQHKIINCFVDDAEHPFQRPFKSTEDTVYTTSSFNRSGNLNGMEALAGETKTMHELASRFNADWIIKRDADSIILNLNPLDNHYDYVGTIPTETREWVWGSCCAYTADTIRQANDFLQDEQKRTLFLQHCQTLHPWQFGEDILMGKLIVGELNLSRAWKYPNTKDACCLYISDDHPLVKNAFAVICKGRFCPYKPVPKTANPFCTWVEERFLTRESIINRMKNAISLI